MQGQPAGRAAERQRSPVKVFGALKDVRFDDRGLVPMIVQDAGSGAVLSLFYANLEALERTVESGFVWRFSRARQELMQKGATSGNTQEVLSLRLDCDADAVLARVVPKGPACHTGEYSCFGNMIPGSWIDQADEAASIRAAYPGTVYPFEEDRELEEKRINKLAEMRKQTEIRDAVDRMLEIKCDSDAKPSER